VLQEQLKKMSEKEQVAELRKQLRTLQERLRLRQLRLQILKEEEEVHARSGWSQSLKEQDGGKPSSGDSANKSGKKRGKKANKGKDKDKDKDKDKKKQVRVCNPLGCHLVDLDPQPSVQDEPPEFSPPRNKSAIKGWVEETLDSSDIWNDVLPWGSWSEAWESEVALDKNGTISAAHDDPNGHLTPHNHYQACCWVA
jgi:hypothetical protein